MRPIDFEEANSKLLAPAGMDDCDDLPVFKVSGTIQSVWELDDEEREAIAAGAPIVLTVVSSNTHPPVSLGAYTPSSVLKIRG